MPLSHQVVERGFRNLRLKSEDVSEFLYELGACRRPYRVVVVRKNLSVEAGEWVLFDDLRYFFYLTNDEDTPGDELLLLANDRCNQENLIEQLKNGVHALRMPVGTLVSNGAYMVMASLAWTLKAWFALLLPETGRWGEQCTAEKQQVLRMEFRSFQQAFIVMPCQILRAGRSDRVSAAGVESVAAGVPAGCRGAAAAAALLGRAHRGGAGRKPTATTEASDERESEQRQFQPETCERPNARSSRESMCLNTRSTMTTRDAKPRLFWA